MKYLIKRKDLTNFDIQMKRFFEENKHNKCIDKIMRYYRKIRSFCFKYEKNKNIIALIKELYLPKQTFYYWAKKFYECFYYEQDFSNLILKSTKPKTINYFYDYHLSEQFINYFIQYQQEYGIGAFQFCHLLKNVNDQRFNNLPKPSVKTIYRWLRRFHFKIKKQQKRKYPSYEVKEIGLLQTDIKVITEKITGTKKWYIMDYIDEKTRIVFSYPSQECQTIDVAVATKAALQFYQQLGITVTRIRTDNGAQYTASANGKHRKNRWFTNFCNERHSFVNYAF